jgi:hypothetical protein
MAYSSPSLTAWPHIKRTGSKKESSEKTRQKLADAIKSNDIDGFYASLRQLERNWPDRRDKWREVLSAAYGQELPASGYTLLNDVIRKILVPTDFFPDRPTPKDLDRNVLFHMLILLLEYGADPRAPQPHAGTLGYRALHLCLLPRPKCPDLLLLKLLLWYDPNYTNVQDQRGRYIQQLLDPAVELPTGDRRDREEVVFLRRTLGPEALEQIAETASLVQKARTNIEIAQNALEHDNFERASNQYWNVIEHLAQIKSVEGRSDDKPYVQQYAVFCFERELYYVHLYLQCKLKALAQYPINKPNTQKELKGIIDKYAQQIKGKGAAHEKLFTQYQTALANITSRFPTFEPPPLPCTAVLEEAHVGAHSPDDLMECSQESVGSDDEREMEAKSLMPAGESSPPSDMFSAPKFGGGRSFSTASGTPQFWPPPPSLSLDSDGSSTHGHVFRSISSGKGKID